MRRKASLLCVLLLVTLSIPAQTGQYPPGTYPPQTYPPQAYPPGSYPPGSYPPNTYPTRLPGGIPVNIPTPEIKLPKRQSKDKAGDDLKLTVASVEGSLRRLREKDLLLQTAKSILRFRLLPKTQFRNKAGEPVRDSLIHPGDQLAVQVSPDDEETALRVIVLRAGTPAERAGAEQTVDEAAVRAPRAEDLGKRSVLQQTASAPVEGTSDPGKADMSPLPGEVRGDMPAGIDLTTASSGPLSDEELIREARSAAATFSAGLPNFLAHQITKRYFSQGLPANWRQLDTVTAELAYAGGKEDYRNVQVDGQPALRPVEQTGAWSTGEFGTTLEDLMAPSTNAVFTRRGEERVASRAAVVFNFKVDQANSHWTLVSPDQRRYNPAYDGAIWVDKDTHRVLRIEQKTVAIPKEYPFTKAETILNYAYVRIEDRTYLVPAAGDTLGCMNGGSCTRNAIEFKDYRRFVAESKVVY